MKGDSEGGSGEGWGGGRGAGAGGALRTMTTADLDAVLGLEHDLFGEEAWSRQMLEGELAEQPRSRCYLVAEDDGALVGYAGLLVSGHQADVLTLAVAAGRWGRGIGSGLLEALLAEAARRGATSVFLEVRVGQRPGAEPVQQVRVQGDRDPEGLLPAVGRRRAGDAARPG